MFILLSFTVCLLVLSHLSYCVIFSELIDLNFLDKTSGNNIITVSKFFIFLYLSTKRI